MRKSKKIYVPTMELCFDKDNRIESIEVIGQVYTRARRIEECEPTETYCCPCGQDLVSNNVGIANGGAIELDQPELYNYCPNCGAKVRKPEPQVIKNAENYNLRPGIVCQFIPDGEKHELAANDNLSAETDISADSHARNDTKTVDSRERLEADALDYVVRMAKLCHGMGLQHELWQFNPEPLHMCIRQCLDRQAAITERECMTAAGLAATKAPALQAEVDNLTAERDELQSIIDHMPKTEAECEACQEAHDRLMFNSGVDIGKLRDELKHKQLVIDRQRDSFAKMEREYRELQDVCGELERTIENLRGD